MKKSAVDISDEKNSSIYDSVDLDNLSSAEIEGITAGLEDIKAGRVLTHEEVMVRINQELNR